ncbi:MAG: 3-deoxy-7-phosphoheptulonate synthase [Armatimonadota bacterium]|nr:3-deoxy-7-phosphoheptulonate synthase [Armatimonadota bacterium]
MIIVLKPNTNEADLQTLVKEIERRGYQVHLSRGVERTIVGCVGAPEKDKDLLVDQFASFPFVESVVRILKPYKIVNREFHPERTQVQVGNVVVGGTAVVVMAGPCSVESREQLLETAQACKAAGANILRGGAFKPSTSPYSFHGLGEDGLKLLAEARELTGLPVVTEVMDTRHVDLVATYADCLQVGTRNMANFALLRELGDIRKPVLLKRGMSATIEEWMQAAEYIASRGNYNIILCERGIRTFETYTRNTFDVSAIPACKELSHLPVVADPSHATGMRTLVPAVTKAAIAAGADGVIIEVHSRPERALKDGPQALTPALFEQLMRELAPVATAVGRTLEGA